MDDRLDFNEMLRQLDLSVGATDLVSLGNLVTPAFSPVRFDTAFLLASIPDNQSAQVWPGEMTHGFWTTARELLERWRKGDCLVAPPSLALLQAGRNALRHNLATTLQSWLNQTQGIDIGPIYFSPDIELIPLRTEALPPSSHTNAYLIGHDPAYLLDPGSGQASEQDRLWALLDARLQTGMHIAAVLLSHHHADHVGAAKTCSKRMRVPIWAHVETAQALGGSLAVGRHLADGDRLDLGERPGGGGRWHLEVLHTPGHARGHLAFYEPSFGLLFAGDMVSTVSSVVIAPPDGDLAVYLQSLRRLRALPVRLLLPSHGGVSSRSAQVIDEWLAHRAKREEMLVQLLGQGCGRVTDLAVELYKGVPEPMMRFAQLQVEAGLRKLQQEGRVTLTRAADVDHWQLPKR
jgi:glyoxylase-like metal-dependent hydrolase (beta-lactamase superfamily II)